MSTGMKVHRFSIEISSRNEPRDIGLDVSRLLEQHYPKAAVRYTGETGQPVQGTLEAEDTA